MNELTTAIFNLTLAMAKAEAEEDEDLPPLFEDEIAEILDKHKGEEILIHYRPDGPLCYSYYGYDHSEDLIPIIYDALENHCLVTVDGTNILDL